MKKSNRNRTEKSNSNVYLMSDILRVDSKESILSESPQKSNIEWLMHLLKPFIFPLDLTIITTGENNIGFDRIGAYSKIGAPLSQDGWIQLYEGMWDLTRIDITELFGGQIPKLVITFEAPPYLYKLLKKYEITFIDFCISPIRFCKDYFLSARTNCEDIASLLEEARLKDSHLSYAAELKSAIASRRIPDKARKEGALFIGQLPVDAALIEDGCIPSEGEILELLVMLTIKHSQIYYKPHPQLTDETRSRLESLIKNISRCFWLDRNIYDTLAIDEWESVYGLSSSSIDEAYYFSKQGERLLKKHWHFPRHAKNKSSAHLFPYKYIDNQKLFSSQFWQKVFKTCGVNVEPQNLALSYEQGNLRDTLMVRWG